MSATQNAGTVDAAEVAKFEAMAAEWWDPNGKFKPLHMLNPAGSTTSSTRSPRSSAATRRRRGRSPGSGSSTSAAAAGCSPSRWRGSGPRSSASTRRPRNIPVARLHAAQSELAIDYRHGTAEALAAAGERFDVVLNMEVVEHVPDPPPTSPPAATLLRPGGLMICSTINRNPKSWLLAIVGAEHVLRWLPKRHARLAALHHPRRALRAARAAPGLEPVDRKGFVFDPLGWSWRLSDRDLSVNYVAAAIRPADPLPG